MENIQIILGLILVVIIGVLIYKSHQKSKRIELFETIFMIAQKTALVSPDYFVNFNCLDNLKLPYENPDFKILMDEYQKLKKGDLDTMVEITLEESLAEIFYKSNSSIYQKETSLLLKKLTEICKEQTTADIKYLILRKIFTDPKFDFGFLQTLQFAQASCKEDYKAIAYLHETKSALDNYLPTEDSGLDKWQEIRGKFELVLKEASNGNALNVINQWIGRNGAPPAN